MIQADISRANAIRTHGSKFFQVFGCGIDGEDGEIAVVFTFVFVDFTDGIEKMFVFR